jgi:hypothetical protein
MRGYLWKKRNTQEDHLGLSKPRDQAPEHAERYKQVHVSVINQTSAVSATTFSEIGHCAQRGGW